MKQSFNNPNINNNNNYIKINLSSPLKSLKSENQSFEIKSKASGLFGSTIYQNELSSENSKNLKLITRKTNSKFIQSEKNIKIPNISKELPEYESVYQKPNEYYRKIFKLQTEDDLQLEPEFIQENKDSQYISFSKKPSKKDLLNRINNKIRNDPIFQTKPFPQKKVFFQDEFTYSKKNMLLNLNKKIKNHAFSDSANQFKIKLKRIPHIIQDFEGPPLLEQTIIETKQCKTCGREFNLEIFEKHKEICKKNFGKKIKVFDFKQKRNVNDINNNNSFNIKNNDKIIDKSQKYSIPDWKLKSQALRFIVKAANGENLDKKEENIVRLGFKNKKLVECENCNKFFNEFTAEKHIPNCKNKKNILKLHKKMMKF